MLFERFITAEFMASKDCGASFQGQQTTVDYCVETRNASQLFLALLITSESCAKTHC